jgi:hypothetical protein
MEYRLVVVHYDASGLASVHHLVWIPTDYFRATLKSRASLQATTVANILKHCVYLHDLLKD